MPVFVKVEEYKEVKETLAVLKNKVIEAKVLLRRLNEIKEKENLYIAEWDAQVAQAEKKIEKITTTIG